jgi:4-amino-4-deoxy-L-arabinose transferase-like glycosyltransferase
MKDDLHPISQPDPPAFSNEAAMIEERPVYAKQVPYILAGLIALAAVVFVFGLGGIALLGPDEPRYAEVAREMHATGDYISPRLCGCLWFEKPALFYWLAAGSYRLFGVGEFGARFPSALGAGLSAAAVALVLWRFVSPRLGVLASLVLLTSGLFIGYSRAATPDMLLALSITVALLSGYAMTVGQERSSRVRWLLLCGASTGLSVLAKGLVGVVLISGILGLYFAITGKRRAFSWKGWAAAIGVFLVVASVWYLPVTVEHGWSFVDQFFIDHHFKRYVSNRFYHPQPFYFYPAVALLGVMPWSLFLTVAALRIRRLRPRSDRWDSLVTLAWVWVGVPVVFFSFSVSKLPGYILPIFPALAIIVGYELERLWQGKLTRLLKASLWLTALLLVCLGVGYTAYMRHLVSGAAGGQMVWLWLPVTVAVAAAGLLAASKRRTFLFGAVAFVVSVVLGAALLLFPRVNDQWSLKRLSLEAAAALLPDEKIGFFIYKEFAPVFYAEGRVACGHPEGDILNALSQDRLAAALEKEPSLVVITLTKWQDDLEEDGRFEMEFIGSQGDALAFRVRMKR